eukprot:m51a1_g10887 hypothetical protein (67) ;mRNA; f:6126-6326
MARARPLPDPVAVVAPLVLDMFGGGSEPDEPSRASAQLFDAADALRALGRQADAPKELWAAGLLLL